MRSRYFLLMSVVSCVALAQDSRPFCSWLDADLAARVPRLRTLMADALHQEKPTGRLRNDPVVEGHPTMFTGSYDRHSNIAAWWALLNWARRIGDRAELDRLMGQFTIASLANERAYVEGSREKALLGAYAEAWLFLLLDEVARDTASDDLRMSARGFAASIEDRLLTFAEQAPDPGVDDGASRPASRPASRTTTRVATRRIPRDQWMSGTYDSALWPLILVQLGHPTRPETAARVRAIFQRRLPEIAAVLAARATTSRPVNTYEFLHLPAVAALGARLSGSDAANASVRPFVPPAFVPPPATITLGNCHLLGAQISVLWPLGFDAGGGADAARAAFQARLRLCMEREEAWAGPFVTVSHWVPQFLYLGLWLADGRG